MIEIQLTKDQKFAHNSLEFPVLPGKKYLVMSEVIGYKGERCSAYLAIIMIDGSGKEIVRRIRWLNDFSGRPVRYTIVAEAPENAKSAVIAYRINTEIAIESEWVGSVTEIEKLNLTQVSNSLVEDYDDIMDAHRARALINLKTLSEQEENQIERNITWIFGSPRSGSSWLGTQLLCHHNIISINEPLIGAHLSILETNVWSMLNPPKNGNLIEMRRTIDVHSEEPDYIFCHAYRDVWMFFLRKMILHRIYCQFPESLDKKIVIKEPNGSLSADIILQIVPNSKIIFLLRDGRDIVDSKIDIYRQGSWVKKWIQPPPLTPQRRGWIIISDSNIWRKLTETVRAAYEKHDPSRRLLIKYEDLRYETMKQLKKIYNFLEVPITDEELADLVNRYSFENIPKDEKGEGKVVRKARPGGWRETFTEEEKEVMHSIMGDLLKEFGYAI